MSTEWRTAKLGQLCSIVGGGTPPKDRPDLYNGDIPWATVRDMRDDVLTETECTITADALQSCSTNLIPKGNVVLATRVGLGKVCLLAQDTAINQDLRGVIPSSTQLLAPPFLFWWFKSIAPAIVAAGSGATVQGVKLPFISSLHVPLPPVAEQLQVATILNVAFDGIAAARANAERNLRNARMLLTNQLEWLFDSTSHGWTNSTLGQQTRFIDYRGRTPTKTDAGLRLVTAKNVRMGHLQRTPAEFVDPTIYDKWMTRGIPRRGDVLFTTEAPLANVAQLDTDERTVFAQRIIIMQTDSSELDSTFLKYALLSGPVQRRIHAKATGATAQGIKASLLKTVEISFPASVPEQREVIARLDVLAALTTRLEKVYRRKLAALDELQRSLLHHAFTGRLTERAAAALGA